MSAGELQQGIDRLAMVSSQRWLFGTLAVVAAGGASAAASAAGASASQFVVLLILGLASAAAFHPDSHAALLVEAMVVWQWLAGTDDATDPWVIAVASSLFVFHTVIALMAVTPSSAVVDRVLLLRWLRRG